MRPSGWTALAYSLQGLDSLCAMVSVGLRGDMCTGPAKCKSASELDCIINSITKQFEHFKTVALKFSCLYLKNFGNVDNVTKLEFLADRYSDVIESRIKIVQEFLPFKDMYND